jgi:hypothetical protein
MGDMTATGFFPVKAQPEEPVTERATLLLIDPHNPRRLSVHLTRGWDRLVVRLLASSLDHKLAAGRSPESHRLLATRAHMLVSPALRRVLARNWENVVVQAHRPPVMRNPRAPLNRAGVMACERQIQQMIEALVSAYPTPARGVAMASLLLRDGTGPLYHRRGSLELEAALLDAVAQLDPWISL